MSDHERALKSLVDVLAHQPSVERVILFGSRARGEALPGSDIDVCVAAPTAGRADWLEIWTAVDEAATLHTIDLVRFEDASPELRERILEEGRTLYERRPAA